MARLPGLLGRISPFAWAVAGLTVLGFALRLATFDQSLFADELSTYWIVHDKGLGDVLSTVRSNDEITPPLYFVLSWLTLKIGGAPEWVRLPSLVAGTATIPLVYLVGARTLGRVAGAIAAAVIALSPFMIYYSVEARAYALMIALLTLSTLALLKAVEDGRVRWWVVYAVCSCAAVYSHYTAVFALGAQVLWVVWKHREALRGCLLANVAAAVAFAPWIPGFIADNNSPTTKILDALQQFDLDSVWNAIETWGLGYPYVNVTYLPGRVAAVMIAAGVLLAAGAGVVRLWRDGRTRRVIDSVRDISAGPALVVLLLLSTPIGEAVVSAVGTNLLGARNLNASWPGLALAIGGLLASAAVPVLVASSVLVLGGYAIGAQKALGSGSARPDYAGAAEAIEQRWKPGDVVVDGVAFTPVPLTGLDVYLPQTNPEVRLGLPTADRPFLPFDPIPSIDEQAREVIRSGRDHSIFLVANAPRNARSADVLPSQVLPRQDVLSSTVLRRLPSRFEVHQVESEFPGLTPFVLIEIKDRGPADRR